MRLKNKTALVTGSARGIGAAIARRFSEEGATVFIADLDEPEGTKTAGEITKRGGTAFFVLLDVTSEASWEKALAVVVERSGCLDILINNAGINIREPIEEMKEESLDAMLAVNVKGPFMGIKHAIPLMRKNGGGSIINMSSICGLVGHKYTTEAYTTTKGAAHVTDKVRRRALCERQYPLQLSASEHRRHAARPGIIQRPAEEGRASRGSSARQARHGSRCGKCRALSCFG